jgi:transmembrane sensor
MSDNFSSPSGDERHLPAPTASGELAAEQAARAELVALFETRESGFEGDLSTGIAARLIAQRLGSANRVSDGEFAPVSASARRLTPARFQRTSASQTLKRVLPLSIAALALGMAVMYARAAHSPVRESEQRFATRVGEQQRVTLPDGTRIRLAPQSQLVLGDAFGHGHRTVTLLGEAYFDVKVSEGIPFIVRTGSVSTRVLGTAFGVRHRANDTVTLVSVISGRVQTATRGASATLSAGATGQATDSTVAVLMKDGPASGTDWTRGELVFKRTAVPVMLAELGRWYGYQFRLADSTLATQNVSAVFKLSDPQEMIVVLKGTLDVELTFSNRVVTLTPRRTLSVPGRKILRSESYKPHSEVGR